MVHNEQSNDDVQPKVGLERMGFDDSEKGSVNSNDLTGFLLVLAGLVPMVGLTWFLILSNDPVQMGYFAFHPPLQVLAIAFFAYGILTLQPTSLAQPKAKAAGFARHQFFIAYLGVPVIFVGSLAIMVNKSVHGYDHFTTWHGFLGFVVLLWMSIQAFIGGGSVWYGGRLFGRNPKAVYKYHRASGYPLLLLSLFVLHLAGAWSNFAVNNMGTITRFIVFLVGPILVGLGIFTRIRFDKMPIF